LASEQTVKTHVSRGDIVYVELEKSNNSYNLEYGTFLSLASIESPPEPAASCISLQDLPVDGAVSMENSKCAGKTGTEYDACIDALLQVKIAVQAMATEADFEKKLDQLSDILDVTALAGLSGAGEIIGTPAAFGSLMLNLHRGKTKDALLDVVSLIPIGGKLVQAGKMGPRAAAMAAKFQENLKLSKFAKTFNVEEKLRTAYQGFEAEENIRGVVDAATAAERQSSGAEYFWAAINARDEEGNYMVDEVLDGLDSLPGPQPTSAAMRALIKEIRGE